MRRNADTNSYRRPALDAGLGFSTRCQIISHEATKAQRRVHSSPFALSLSEAKLAESQRFAFIYVHKVLVISIWRLRN